MKVDLHLHTWVSDGDASPSDIVRLASSAGLAVIAVTDHDTAAGVAEARAAADLVSMTVVPGIEVSTRWDAYELHILGYWIDPDSPSILGHQQGAVQRRALRMQAMVDLLREMEIDITLADVEQAAGPSVHALGRPHLARALHAGGHTRYYGEAFARYIGDGGPAFVGEGYPTPEDAIARIHAAGGVAVWAHPPLPWFEEGLPLLAGWGLDGVECYRPGTDAGDIAMLEHGTRKYELFPTGGSDWHGPHRSPLGEFTVDGYRVRHLLELGGLTV
ncbi:MAG: PHP domain-containing protein [Gemmatimonadota bacterium]